ncbi:unnamed protein product [Coffea canephora]|uniref:Uncharacterized protein n=1 Tax=Coffea canephora TaxID=49390 RepID=A0A068UL90_COFCA|nr:unnamed protein product [Coffea canephora]
MLKGEAVWAWLSRIHTGQPLDAIRHSHRIEYTRAKTRGSRETTRPWAEMKHRLRRRLCRPFSSIPIPRPNQISVFQTPQKTTIDDDEKFISILNDIVRGKESWKSAFTNPSISAHLKPHHVEKVLISNLHDSRGTARMETQQGPLSCLLRW